MKLAALILMVASGTYAEQVQLGFTLQNGPVSVVPSYFGCPVQGVPGLTDCDRGIMISVQSTDAETLGFLVTVTYLDASGILRSASSIAGRQHGPNAYASVAFAIGWVPMASVKVAELKPVNVVSFK